MTLNAVAVGAHGISFVWLLMVLSVRAQCPDPRFNLEDSDIAGLVANIRLDVKCSETEVTFNVSSGGIYVNEIHIFQECVSDDNTPNVTTSGESRIVQQIVYDIFESTMDERVIPNPVVLSGMECSYSGCYRADRRKHIFPYVLTLLAETKCTFTKEAAPSSRHTKTSMKTATLIHHTLTQRIPSTAVMSSMQPSSISALQLKSTPFTHSKQKPSSINHESPDTPAPPTLAIVSQGNGNAGLQWMALLILFPVILCALLGFCLVLRRVDMRQEKSKFQHDIHTEWAKWQSEETLDPNFFPILVDLHLKSPSLYSLDTVVNELDCSSTSKANHTTLPGEPVQSTNTTHKINSSISCVSDISQNSDTDNEENLQKRSIFHATRVTGENQAENSHPTVAMPQMSLTSILDPTANVYDYSLGSREYVLVSSLSYSGGSGRTTLTTIASHHDDLRVQQNNSNNTTCPQNQCDHS